MKLLKKIPFSHNGKTYEIRVLHGNNTVNIATFTGNYPANGFRHQIMVPKSVDPNTLLTSDILSEMVEISMDHVRMDRWEKLRMAF